MRRRRPVRFTTAGAVVASLVVITAACGSASTPPAARGAPGTPAPMQPTTTSAPIGDSAAGREGVPAFGHIFVVVMENLGASGALGVPDVAALTRRFQSTTSWYALSHPSLPNYLALVSGSTWGVTSDCTSCFQAGANLASELAAAGIPWGAYFGAMPAPCFLGPQSPDGRYAEKHDPFAYFTDVRSSTAACAHLQPLSALLPLLPGPAAGVPRLVWVTPDMCDSGHDCAPSTAGAWLRSFVGQVTASPAWTSGGLLVVTWDEGDDDAGLDPTTGAVRPTGGGGAVLTIVATPGAPAGRSVAGPYSHYSLLRTIEDALGLPWLGAAGSPGVHPLRAFFAGGT